MKSVGLRLREMRRRRDLGQRELAIRSGIAHSTLSLIERNRISPSIDTLRAIVDSLGTTLTAFFMDLDGFAARSPFYTQDDLVEIGQFNRISYKMIGDGFPNRQLLMLHEIYAPGSDTGEAISHPSQEAGFVLSGEIEVTVGLETKILRAGDGYYFDSRVAHRFRNVSSGPSEIISAVTPPSY